jgi:hypothetical protein
MPRARGIMQRHVEGSLGAGRLTSSRPSTFKSANIRRTELRPAFWKEC